MTTKKNTSEIKDNTTDEVWTLVNQILTVESDYKERITLTSDDERKITSEILRLLDRSVE